jgi:hypothetical protein
VPRSRPEAGCHDVAFHDAYPIDEAGEVALEDYAREVARAAAAELVSGREQAAGVAGVHLCGAGAPPTSAVRADIEDFARGLAAGDAARRRWS